MTEAVQVAMIHEAGTIVAAVITPVILWKLAKPTVMQIKVSVDGLLQKAMDERGDKRYIEGGQDKQTEIDAAKGRTMP